MRADEKVYKIKKIGLHFEIETLLSDKKELDENALNSLNEVCTKNYL